MTLDFPLSMNNRLIVEAYKKEGLRATEKNGFAFVSQKLALKGLKVLVDTRLDDGTRFGLYVRKGSTAYIREESLHTQAWAQKALECETLPCPFLIVDMQFVEFLSPPPDEAA